MITCKEDLTNTYVKNTPELRREFLSLAVKFGLIDSKSEICESSEEAVVAYWRDVTGDNPRVGCWFSYADQIKEECRELTLSDLKPRTKVEYEKVEFEPNEIWKAFKEHQEVGYLYVNTPDGFECLFDGVFNLAMAISQGDQLYRKVERSVEWWEDAVEFIVENDDDDLSAYFDKQSGNLRINTNLPRDKWCDFARILLEQEGE